MSDDGGSKPMEFTDVSVVMITLNEEEAIAKVIEDVLRQAGVLRVAINRHQPGTIKRRQTDEHQG